ncbi:hypothetical protein BJY52DRAFT_1216762 [Lactarius psammicola]|nr:hypothetical protein BJY52DRAFT_1216762 [Lactarius psammicola]
MASPFVSLPHVDDEPLVKLTDWGSRTTTRGGQHWHHHQRRAATPLALAHPIPAHGATSSAPTSVPASASVSATALQTKSRAPTPGMYDGRGIMASGFGIALFALATRSLPFDPSFTPLVDANSGLTRRRWVFRVVRGERA